MPKLQTFFECLGESALEHAAGPLELGRALGSGLLPTVRTMHARLAAKLSSDGYREALQEALSVPPTTLALTIDDAVTRVASRVSEQLRRALVTYLSRVPLSVSQFIRRPGDPDGISVPGGLEVDQPEDWIALVPDRIPRYREEDLPDDLDNWKLDSLRGLGNGCEAWLATDDQSKETPTACLKFVTDPKIRKNFQDHEDYFVQILDLEAIPTVIPLRSVYLLTDPPCLEYPYYSGYDLAGVMNDWRWRHPTTKPDQAILVIRRLVRGISKLHRQDPPVIHGAIKPSNILVNPTPDGKVTIWIGDLGWGLLSTLTSLHENEEGACRRAAKRGALASNYASPQLMAGEVPSPRDDVYALGMLWYQMLMRDPAAPRPTDNGWAMEFRDWGLTDGQARLIGACIDPDPKHRARDAFELASQVEANLHFGTAMDGSKTFQLGGSSTLTPPAPPPSPEKPVARVKTPPPEPIQPTASPFVDLPKRFHNPIGMSFVLVPNGAFLMGSPDDERGRHGWEGPQRAVTITKPFYLGSYPITQGQYSSIMGKNPAAFNKLHGGGPDHPVEQVSWDDAMEFCHRLMMQPSEAENCRIYRLPTEAEWEFACRAETTTPFFFGDTLTLRHAHYFGMDPSNWKRETSLSGKTTKVGSYPANSWGLFDMHGNVLEWCADWWSEDYYDSGEDIDPQGPETGRQRVVRGGSFSQFAAECRSAARLGRAPNSRMNTIGFRVVLALSG